MSFSTVELVLRSASGVATARRSMEVEHVIDWLHRYGGSDGESCDVFSDEPREGAHPILTLSCCGNEWSAAKRSEQPL